MLPARPLLLLCEASSMLPSRPQLGQIGVLGGQAAPGGGELAMRNRRLLVGPNLNTGADQSECKCSNM